MTDNVTNMILAQLLLGRRDDRVPSWLQPYVMPPAAPPRDFEDVFESTRRQPPSSGWLHPDQMYSREGVVPPDRWGPWIEPPPVLYP
jgi:hypothetical protein